MCLCLTVGATFALFTSSSEVNIAVTSASVDVKANVENFQYKTLSQDWTVALDNKTKFDNIGGTAVLDGNVITLDKIVPGDAVKFDVKITNNSNVNVKYRVAVRNLSDDNIFFKALDVDVDGEDFSISKISSWEMLEPSIVEVDTISVVIELPKTAEGRELMGKTSKLLISVEAIQGNAKTTDDVLTGTFNEFVNAINSGKPITLTNDIIVPEEIKVSANAVINGKGFEIVRENGYTGNVFTVTAGNSLTLNDVVVDGGAIWVSTLSDGAVQNAGIKATGNLIVAESNAKIILNEGAVLQNNDGSHAVNLGTRIGATLTLNGGEILYNRSDSGAVWGGGNITVNSGKINNNMSTGSAGAIRMVSNCNLTMNGGEISGNTSVKDGGAIWGYGSSTYNFNGGSMSNNVSAGTGGAIYVGTYSVINISGDFKMCNNTAVNSGAIRLTDHTSMTITGGTISGNTQSGSSNAFNTWNNSISITGGTLTDDMSFVGGLGLTIGEADITGVISYNLSTNHNTAYLATSFNSFKFTVYASNAYFAYFNFKPADGYIYAEGDESKLICLNEGYSTYWDEETKTFRLQSNN